MLTFVLNGFEISLFHQLSVLWKVKTCQKKYKIGKNVFFNANFIIFKGLRRREPVIS